MDLINRKVYYLNSGRRRIQRADLDNGLNSNIEDVIRPITTRMHQDGAADIELDVSNKHIYWSNSSSNTISRRHFNGRFRDSLTIHGAWLSSPTGIKFDPGTSKLYVINSGERKIQSVDVNDTSNREEVAEVRSGAVSIDLDVVENHVYWSNSRTGKIKRAVINPLTNIEVRPKS